MADIKAEMTRFYDEVFNAGNVDLIDELCTEDFVETEPFPGLGNDREAVKQFVTMMREAFEGMRMTVDALYVDGNTAIARARMQGKHVGGFLGIAATGREIDVPTVDIVEFDDEGRATSHWGVTDGGMLMEQLGTAGQESETATA